MEPGQPHVAHDQDAVFTDLKARRKVRTKKTSRGLKKNRWKNDQDPLYGEYVELEERCVDVAAKPAVEAYQQRGCRCHR